MLPACRGILWADGGGSLECSDGARVYWESRATTATIQRAQEGQSGSNMRALRGQSLGLGPANSAVGLLRMREVLSG